MELNLESNVTAIKTFFEADGGRKVSMQEMKDLSADERAQLGDLIREYYSKNQTN